MDKGRIVYDGEPAALRADPEYLARLIGVAERRSGAQRNFGIAGGVETAIANGYRLIDTAASYRAIGVSNFSPKHCAGELQTQPAGLDTASRVIERDIKVRDAL